MKSFLFLTLLIFVLYLVGFLKRIETIKWMDKNFTTAIKGFSILTVVWAHAGGRLGVGGIQFIAGIGVALFLLCSGYGLEVSYERNGLMGFWKKRLFSVCLPFWLVELCGLLISGSFSLETYFLDFTFIKPATSYGWFMGYIIICYLIFYVIKRFIADKKKQLILFIVSFIVWFVVESVFFANPDMPFLRARQMLSFPCGIILAINRNKIETIITKNSLLVFVWGGYNVYPLHGNNANGYC